MLDQGTNSFGPGMAAGVKGGLYYVNNVLGGVHGQPIKAILCNSDGTTATEVNCANDFVSKGVVAVEVASDPGITSEEPILARAHIPLFFSVPSDNTSDASQTAFNFGSPQAAFAVGPFEIFKKLGLTNLALSIADLPAGVGYFKAAAIPTAKKLGMTLHPVYFDPSNTNWQVVAQTELSYHPQVAGIIAGSEGGCTSLLKALRGDGYKGAIVLGGCSAFATSDPTDAPDTYTFLPVWVPPLRSAAPAVSQQQIDAYTSAMAKSGTADAASLGQYAGFGFAPLPDLRDALLAGSGPYTAASVAADLAKVSNYQAFLGPVGTCNYKAWPGTSACSNGFLFVKAGPGGVFQSVYPGGFAPITPLS